MSFLVGAILHMHQSLHHCHLDAAVDVVADVADVDAVDADAVDDCGGLSDEPLPMYQRVAVVLFHSMEME